MWLLDIPLIVKPAILFQELSGLLRIHSMTFSRLLADIKLIIVSLAINQIHSLGLIRIALLATRQTSTALLTMQLKIIQLTVECATLLQIGHS
jgi:hypothetical protein